MRTHLLFSTKKLLRIEMFLLNGLSVAVDSSADGETENIAVDRAHINGEEAKISELVIGVATMGSWGTEVDTGGGSTAVRGSASMI